MKNECDHFSPFRRITTTLARIPGLFLLMVLLTTVAGNVYSQSITIKGKVVDETGETLPGVTVINKSGTQGATTNIDGEFSMSNVQIGDVLEFSYVGMEPQEVRVSSQSFLNIMMRTDAIGVGEVVVTALGITKQKKTIPYSMQKVSSEELNKTQDPSVLNKLSGKIAGLQVNSSAAIGGTSRLVIRGESSLSRDGNDALVVVDGVPIENSPSSSTGGIDWGSGINDLNADDIESINVLKGAAASALYGSRAGNGVILITTKSGKKAKKFSVNVSSNLDFESLLRYPDTYQYEYAVGKFGGRGLFTDKDGGSNPDNNPVEYYGNNYDETWSTYKYDASKMVPLWYSPTSEGYRAGDTQIQNKGNVQKVPFTSTGKNNFEEFFETGRMLNNHISVVLPGEKLNARISFTNMDKKSMMPGADLKRNNISTNLNGKIGEKLSFGMNINLVNVSSDNRPTHHWGPNSINYLLAWMAPGTNLKALKNYWQPGLEGKAQITWREGHNNIYLVAHEMKNGLQKRRAFGNFNVSYEITPDLKVMLRYGDDITYEDRSYRRPFGTKRYNPIYQEFKFMAREQNTDFLISYNKLFAEDWALSFNFGGNRRKVNYESLSVNADKLLVPELYSLNNSAVPWRGWEGESNKKVNSLYASANIGYKELAFLNVTGRNDWSSTLPKENNSYFYPSVGVSALLHKIIDMPEAISFFKLRAAVAQVGKDTSPYQLKNVLGRYYDYNGKTTYRVAGGLANTNLKPEKSTSYEVGVNSYFFNHRLGIDFTYYNKVTKNQVLGVTIPISSGYSSKIINAGEIKNSGIELLLTGTPIRTDSFKWDITANFSKNNSEVVELAEGLDQYKLTGFGDNGETITSKVGHEVFGIFGYKHKVVEDKSSPYYGQKIYDTKGLPIRKDKPEYLGTSNPDWMLGLTNTFTYKNLSLSFLLDYRHGGLVYSSITNILYGGGYNQETAKWRNEGVKGDGVIELADGGYKPNDITLKGDDIKGMWVGRWRKVSTNNLYDGTFLKLRDINLTYHLPKKWFSKLPVASVDVTLSGRNLFVITDVPNQDPDVYLQGIPGYSGSYFYPTSRTYGFGVNVKF